MSVLRIIDANANRAREALRVMEEAARFLLNEQALSEEAKQLRHDFARTIRSIDGLELHRDTAGDVGTEITTDAENARNSAAEVAIAAGKRLGEALRAIEEYGKLIDVMFAQAIERLRYRTYELERKLNAALMAGQARQWRLCVLLSESVCAPRSWQDVAAAVAGAAPDCIQLREKDLNARELLERARTLRKMIGPETTLIINDRPDVALAAGAHGVHLGQGDLSCLEVRKISGRRLIIGVSTARLEEAKQALADGADYCGVGPMFASTTKDKEHIMGPDYLRQYLQWNRLPHLAIGGITLQNIARLIAAGVRGVAVSAAVCRAEDPAAAVGALQRALEPEAEPEAQQSQGLRRSGGTLQA